MAWLRLLRVVLVGLIVLADEYHGHPVHESQEDDNLQQIVFFTNQDYTGASEEWTRNEPNLQDNSLIGRKAKSFCVRKGVWLVSFNFSIGEQPPSSCTSDNEGIITESVLVNSNIGMVCFSLHDEDKGQSAIYTAIKHLASNKMDEASLSLFDPGWTGTELYLTGNSIKLPSAVDISSFAFTGLESWTLFSSVDHTGVSACLPTGWGASNPGLTGVSFGSNVPLGKVGSAYKGCEEDEEEPYNYSYDDESIQPDLHDEEQQQASITFLSCPEVLSQLAKYVQLELQEIRY